MSNIVMTPYDGTAAPRIIEHDWAEPDLLLMVDEQLIDHAEGATFELCQLEKHPEPLLLPTEPWEGGIDGEPQPVQRDALNGTVLHDPYSGLFHLWYRSHNCMLRGPCDVAMTRQFNQSGSWACHATSKDGIHWVRSNLRRVPYRSSVDNNMFSITVGPILNDHLSGVVPNYTGSGPALIATAYSQFADPVYNHGIIHLSSDNGVDWEPHFPPALPLDGDAHCLMWDSRSQSYLCTTRSAAHAHMIRRLRRRGYRKLQEKRHIALAKSRDLVHWTPMLTILEADENDGEQAQLYHMYIVPFGHLYLGFVQLFYMEQTMHFGPLDEHLCYSRDLNEWHRMSIREPILPRGEAGAWDQSVVSLAHSKPHPEGDRMRFWFGGKNTEHWQLGHTGFSTATLRRDGFACWRAGATSGTITTKPMHMDWATWPSLNVDATDGEARVELCDTDGKPLPGCSAADGEPIRGDHMRATVTFPGRRGSFIRHTGAVRIRVHLRNAKLYAIKAPNVSLV